MGFHGWQSRRQRCRGGRRLRSQLRAQRLRRYSRRRTRREKRCQTPRSALRPRAGNTDRPTRHAVLLRQLSRRQLFRQALRGLQQVRGFGSGAAALPRLAQPPKLPDCCSAPRRSLSTRFALPLHMRLSLLLLILATAIVVANHNANGVASREFKFKDLLTPASQRTKTIPARTFSSTPAVPADASAWTSAAPSTSRRSTLTRGIRAAVAHSCTNSTRLMDLSRSST